MTDRTCRCHGCTEDATAEDLLCDRCRTGLANYPSIVTLRGPDGIDVHYHGRITLDP